MRKSSGEEMRFFRIFSGIFEPKRAFEADTKLREILLVLVIDGLLVGLYLSLSSTTFSSSS